MTIDEIRAYCASSLRDFAHGIGAQDVVIGLSGGIDSAVVAALSVEAFGAQHVHGVRLPGPYSSDHSLTDAHQLALNLGISDDIVSITAAYEGLAREVAPLCKDGRFQGLASENSQARCRMMVLMALSNEYGWMVVNTGNRSEAMMGYSTLYGDTCGAYAPIGGLYKTEVYQLARCINRDAEVIPANILTKAPSAELAPGQRDEDTLGSYDLLDKVLLAHVEGGLDLEGLVAAGFDRDYAAYVVKRTAAYAYKRALEPPFPSIER